MAEFVLKLLETDKASLGAVRCMEALRVAEEEGSIWLRGINASIEMDASLKKLPVQNTFITDQENNLFNVGSVTPVGKLKDLNWQPLTDFIKVEMHNAAFPGKTNSKIPIRLVKTTKAREGTAMLTTLETWKKYAETVSELRLRAIKFAVSNKNEVLVTGHPLPSIPGKEFWEINDLLIPAGYEFEMSIIPVFINERLNKNRKAIILFDTNGRWQKIDKLFFVAGKRSAVRLTKINDD